MPAVPAMFRLSFRALDNKFGDMPDEVRAERLGLSRASVVRARTSDCRYPPRRAEQLAVRAGWLPEEVWGEAWRWADEAHACWRAYVDAVRYLRRDERARRRRGERFWGWPDNYQVPPHTCAVDGCRCGLERSETAA